MESPPIKIGRLAFEHAEYDHDCDVIYLYNGYRFPFDNDVETAEGHMVCSPHPGPEADDDSFPEPYPEGDSRLWPDPEGGDHPWPGADDRIAGPATDLPDLGFDPGRALDRTVPEPDPTELEPEINGLALLAPRQHVREQGRVLLTLPTTPPRIIELGPTKIEAIIATSDPVTHGTE